jgi:hypothetical protein
MDTSTLYAQIELIVKYASFVIVFIVLELSTIVFLLSRINKNIKRLK